MKFLCLVYHDERNLDAMSPADWDILVRDHLAYDEELRQGGHFILGQALGPVRTAATVRVRSGRTSVTDGPFAETREQLGGVILIEARDFDEAVRLAADIPSARVGTIEVRPALELEHDPTRPQYRLVAEPSAQAVGSSSNPPPPEPQ